MGEGGSYPICPLRFSSATRVVTGRVARGGSSPAGNTGDSQQVLATKLSVSSWLPRLMGIENFRLRLPRAIIHRSPPFCAARAPVSVCLYV